MSSACLANVSSTTKRAAKSKVSDGRNGRPVYDASLLQCSWLMAAFALSVAWGGIAGLGIGLFVINYPLMEDRLRDTLGKFFV